MSLNKDALKAQIESAFRSVEPGQDSVSALADALAGAIDSFVKSGTVKVDSQGGACSYSGGHPPVHSEGKVE
jgi:hypothetical protein